YGHHLGMAFQIVDDRLDLTGDEETVGKTLGRDLREGKTTLPVIIWLRTRPEAERRDARALVEASWEDAAAARELGRRLDRDGALQAADALACAEVDLALAELEVFPESDARTVLQTIARYVVERTR
ncbi:MAG: polyprenyl synthetase family protein, partial [Planctomycetota bacterium]